MKCVHCTGILFRYIRPYIVNLLPCIARISKREDEAIQDILAQSMQKICPPLIGFANESEIKVIICNKYRRNFKFVQFISHLDMFILLVDTNF